MAIDSVAKRASALRACTPFLPLPVPDGTVGQGDRQHLLGFYSGISAEAAYGDYNLYVALGSLDDIDFSASPAETFDGNSSQGSLTGYGFAASSKYTLVLRPVLNSGLETPDISCLCEFVTNGAGEWMGLRPDPITGLTAHAKAGGVIRLTWRHRIFDGATPDDFKISYGTTADASGTDATETYAGDKLYTKEITLSDGVTYWFKVVARDGTLESIPRRTLGVTADATAPAQPSITTSTTWLAQT